jgi:hypothetical protein
MAITSDENISGEALQHILENLTLSRDDAVVEPNQNQTFSQRAWREQTKNGNTLWLRRVMIGPHKGHGADKNTYRLSASAPVGHMEAPLNLRVALTQRSTP